MTSTHSWRTSTPPRTADRCRCRSTCQDPVTGHSWGRTETVDYLAILAGSTFHVAIDVHLRRFATQAGIGPRSYGDLRTVINNAAARRPCTPGALDAAVWAFMTDPQRQPAT